MSISQALPLPTIPEGTDDESYGDGMDMDTLLEEMGLGDDEIPATPPRLLQSYTNAAPSSKAAMQPSAHTRVSPPKSASSDMQATSRSPPHPVSSVSHSTLMLTWACLRPYCKTSASRLVMQN